MECESVSMCVYVRVYVCVIKVSGSVDRVYVSLHD